MSIKHVLAAFEARVGNPLRKLVLVKLADNANDKGLCWPSYQYIADHCECSRRVVMNHIAKLEELGFLHIRKRKGENGNSSNIYQLSIEKGSELNSPPSENPALLPSESDSPDIVNEIHQDSEQDSPPSENPAPPPSEYSAPRTSHSLEPVKEPTNEPKGEVGDKFILPKWIDEDTWKQFEKHRRAIKKPMTDHAKKLAVKTLVGLTEQGYDANKLINYAILKCWQGFYEPNANERASCLVDDYQVTTTSSSDFDPNMVF